MARQVHSTPETALGGFLLPMSNTEKSTPNPAPMPVVRDERVYVALPAYGRIDVPFVLSLMQSVASLKCLGQVEFMQGDSLVSRARNNLANLFLNGRPQPDGKGGMHLVQY